MSRRNYPRVVLPLLIFLVLLSVPSFAFRHIRQPISIPMRDTTVLAADLYLPATTGSYPVILIQTPYNKNNFYPIFCLTDDGDPVLKSPSYAYVVLDWRGFYASSSAAYTGSPTNGEDGYDAVEWIASQTWSTGSIGTWGVSALGKVQMQTAAEQPPHLKCAVPMAYNYREWYELYYPGGVYERNKNEFISGYYGGSNAVHSHPLYDSFWSLTEQLTGNPALINIPMLHISGWYDHQTEFTIRDYFAVQTSGGTSARGKQKLLIGPWSHSHIGELQQAELQYSAAVYQSSSVALRLDDYYLRGINNGYPSEPVCQYFRINANLWLSSTTWPPVGESTTTFYFRSDSTLQSNYVANTTDYLQYPVDPTNPVPTVFGAILIETTATQGPGDLRIIESRPDVITLTTPTLATPLTIEGQAKAVVWLSCQTSAIVDTDMMVRLADVYSDGSSMLLVDNAHRVSLRSSYTNKQYLVAGQIVKVEVSIPSVSVTIPVGHKLRVYLEPSNFDRFDVNMQDGSNFSDDSGAVAKLGNIRLYLNSSYPSRIELPTQPISTDAECWELYR